MALGVDDLGLGRPLPLEVKMVRLAKREEEKGV
jgi:hypothetical protein